MAFDIAGLDSAERVAKSKTPSIVSRTTLAYTIRVFYRKVVLTKKWAGTVSFGKKYVEVNNAQFQYSVYFERYRRF